MPGQTIRELKMFKLGKKKVKYSAKVKLANNVNLPPCNACSFIFRSLNNLSTWYFKAASFHRNTCSYIVPECKHAIFPCTIQLQRTAFNKQPNASLLLWVCETWNDQLKRTHASRNSDWNLIFSIFFSVVAWRRKICFNGKHSMWSLAAMLFTVWTIYGTKNIQSFLFSLTLILLKKVGIIIDPVHGQP